MTNVEICGARMVVDNVIANVMIVGSIGHRVSIKSLGQILKKKARGSMYTIRTCAIAVQSHGLRIHQVNHVCVGVRIVECYIETASIPLKKKLSMSVEVMNDILPWCGKTR